MTDSDMQLDRIIAAAKRLDHPDPATTERAWSSLASAFIAGEAPSVPVDVRAPLVAGGAAKSLVLVGIAVVTAIATTVVASAIESRTREQVVSTRVAAVDPVERPVPATLPATPPPHEPAAPPPVEPPHRPADGSASPKASRTARHLPATTQADPAASPSTLAEEARLLGEAWRELNAGASARALEVIAEHVRRFPDSPLAREREAARIVAGCIAGDPRATPTARRFLDGGGEGALEARIERACDTSRASKNP